MNKTKIGAKNSPKPRKYRIFLTGGTYIEREAGLGVESTIRAIIRDGFMEDGKDCKSYYPPYRILRVDLEI